MTKTGQSYGKISISLTDVEEFVRICKNKEHVHRIRKAIADRTLARKDFEKIVPLHLAKLAFATTSRGFKSSLDESPQRIRSLLLKAKTLIKKNFSDILQHPAANAMVEDSARLGPQERKGPMDQGSEINALNWYFVWGGIEGPPKLRPGVHLFFRNTDKKLLLESQMDWSNLSFLASSLAGIFRILMEKGKELLEKGMLDLSDFSENIRKRIEEINGHAQHLENLSDYYIRRLESKGKPRTNLGKATKKSRVTAQVPRSK